MRPHWVVTKAKLSCLPFLPLYALKEILDELYIEQEAHFMDITGPGDRFTLTNQIIQFYILPLRQNTRKTSRSVKLPMIF